MSKDLLKEAIADAKAVRSTAIANAKLALEEAFTPKLQSMLSHKIAEEMDEEMDGEEEELADEETEETGEDVPAEEAYEEGEDVEEVYEEDAELEEIIKELEEEEAEEDEDLGVDAQAATDTIPADTADPGANEAPSDGDDEAESLEEDEDGNVEEMDLDEIIKALQEEDEVAVEEEEEMEEEEGAELEEAYKTIKFLKDKINEVNLLNSKLLYSNKLFRSNQLSESQKMKVIETFDRANSVREVKLVYSTLAESLTGYVKKNKINEGFASKKISSTKPSKDVIVESNTFASRMQKLAGLK